MKRFVVPFIVGLLSGVLGIFVTGWWLGPPPGPEAPVPRASQSQIQLEGALPVEPASNDVLSYYQDKYDVAIERCWRGVTYVIFPLGTSSVGSVVILPDGKPLTCDSAK